MSDKGSQLPVSQFPEAEGKQGFWRSLIDVSGLPNQYYLNFVTNTRVLWLCVLRR